MPPRNEPLVYYHPGSQVRVHIGSSIMNAEVIEDRGPLGVKGEHVFRVRLTGEYPEPVEWELSSSFLEPSPARELQARHLH